MNYFLVLALLVVGSVALWWAGRWLRQRFSFLGTGLRPARGLRGQLASYRYGITGKPDLIIERDGLPIPVLIKSGRANTTPHESHIAQIIVYCLLVEDATQTAPPYGIIRYDNRTFEVDYDDEMYEMLIDLLEEMHAEREHFGPELARSHSIRQRCFACRHRTRCEESLV